MLVWTAKTELFENADVNVDGEHRRFRGKSCVFKFIRLSVDVASVTRALQTIFSHFKNYVLVDANQMYP